MLPAFVVLTDLSTAAESALTYATLLAQRLSGRLQLLHVYQDPMVVPEAAMVTVPLVLESRKVLLSELVERALRLPIPASAELAVGPFRDAVAEAVQVHHPLLLVLGREKDPTLLDQLIRLQATPILQAARYPLLLVPEGYTSSRLPRRLVVAADDQPFWLTAPSLALSELLDHCYATTTVVHVAPESGPSRADVGLASVQRTGLFGSLTGNSLYEIREAAPADGILQAAEELQAEMVVVLARPHSFLGGLFHRSVTAQVLRHSKVPVLVLPTTA
ncbi:universal stress protein [Hymenobacter chitinivorans]|nr:universal stress protein [Hymenobacter chitinivorans]